MTSFLCRTHVKQAFPTGPVAGPRRTRSLMKPIVSKSVLILIKRPTSWFPSACGLTIKCLQMITYRTVVLIRVVAFTEVEFHSFFSKTYIYYYYVIYKKYVNRPKILFAPNVLKHCLPQTFKLVLRWERFPPPQNNRSLSDIEPSLHS